MSTTTPTWKPVVSLILAMLIWGSSFTLLKLAMLNSDAIVVIFSRLVIASLIFLLLIKQVKLKSYRAGDWKWLLLMAFFEPCLYFIFETQALRFTSAAAAATIIALLPLAVAIAAHLLLAEWLSPQLWLGILLTILGTFTLIFAGQPTELAPEPIWGNLLECCALWCSVGYALVVKKLSQFYSAFFLTAMQNFLGSLLFLPLLLLPSIHFPPEFSYLTGLTLFYLGSVVSVLAFLLYNYGISQMPVSQATVYTSLIPLFAILFDWWILEETLTLLQLIAMIVMILGVISSSTPSLPLHFHSRSMG